MNTTRVEKYQARDVGNDDMSFYCFSSCYLF